MPFTRIIVGALLMTIVLGAVHFYLWRRLIRDIQLPPRWHRILSIGLALALLSQPLLFVFGRTLPREVISPFAFAGYVWLGMLSTYFSLTGPPDFVRSMFHRVAQLFKKNRVQDQPDPEKRQALKRFFAGGVFASGAALGATSVNNALDGFRIKKIEIALSKLPHAFDGFRIVQLSDIHVGPTLGKDFVSKIVETANSLEPDLIAITGDLVDGTVENLGRHTAPLVNLKSEFGSFFVTGNHEYYSGVEQWVEEVERLGITHLRNQRVTIRRNSESFLLAGVTDFRAGRYGDAPDLAFTLRDRKPHEEVVLLAHQPREIDNAKKLDVGLQLSGHTHGGQFWPWSWVIHLIEPVVSGWAQFARTQIYVNSGTGYWGPPMRMGTESEITLITLRSRPEKSTI